ncbi:MAG: hypothetical protein M1381_06600 [Deltaproteobacteria bacterium]|nr:hypothetical protein [Deltaproteobacteria bacterium]MCL5792545.1 hypothetical protein [Deltaproteobacteria bacterium]
MQKPDQKQKIIRGLREFSLKNTDFKLSESEIIRQLEEKKGSLLYLGVFTKEEVMDTLYRFHIFQELKTRGFTDTILDINTDDPHRHSLRIYFNEINKEHLLVEIILSEGIFKPRVQYLPSYKSNKYNMLMIEWLVLQNPLKQFLPEKTKLPGQQYPGLGMARNVNKLLISVAKYLKKDGILNFPQYYHNAVIYSEFFKFYNPYMHGILKALEHSLSRYPLDQVSNAMSMGCIKDLKDGTNFEWKAEELILPLSSVMVRYFYSGEYQNIVTNTMKKYDFDVDWGLYRSKIKI